MRNGAKWLGLVIFGASASSTQAANPTYHKDVLPILQKNCQDCHRPGQVAPFSLLTYDQTRKRATDIAFITAEKQMPPWHASIEQGGPFKDARVLSKSEIETLAAWNQAGAPEGNPKDAPPALQFGSDWPLGTPDLIVKMPESYTLAAEGKDELRVFVLPTGLTEGKWVKAMDFRPGNAKVVHHILLAFDSAGRARKLDDADKDPGYKSFAGFGLLPSGGLGGWAPGKSPRPVPDGTGRFLPAKSDLLLQIHYHRSGKPEVDQTSVGLYFAKDPVDKAIRGRMVVPPRQGMFGRPDLKIPAGDSNYEIKGQLALSEDVHVTAVVPHMHWLGKDFVMTATLPDGSKKTLIRVDRWDFNWQDTYDFLHPVALPAGTKVDMVAHFDNSDANPSNPAHPPVEVRWGEETTNEMCIGFLQMTADKEHLLSKKSKTGE